MARLDCFKHTFVSNLLRNKIILFSLSISGVEIAVYPLSALRNSMKPGKALQISSSKKRRVNLVYSESTNNQHKRWSGNEDQIEDEDSLSDFDIVYIVSALSLQYRDISDEEAFSFDISPIAVKKEEFPLEDDSSDFDISPHSANKKLDKSNEELEVNSSSSSIPSSDDSLVNKESGAKRKVKRVDRNSPLSSTSSPVAKKVDRGNT